MDEKTFDEELFEYVYGDPAGIMEMSGLWGVEPVEEPKEEKPEPSA